MSNTQRGFTLVELAIALVIIGLVLGMTFKGRELIDGAKVKSVQAQYGKISAAMNIFFEKYGFIPVMAAPAPILYRWAIAPRPKTSR